MERLIVVVCGEAGGSGDVEQDLMQSVQRALPSCTESEFRGVLRNLHRVVTAPAPGTMQVAKALFPYAREIAVDESAVGQSGRVDAHQIIATSGCSEKQVQYYEENSINYGYNTPSGKYVIGVVEDWYFSRCIKTSGTKRLLRVDFTATKKPSCSRYAEDVQKAKLQVTVQRKLREISAKYSVFIAEIVSRTLSSLDGSFKQVTIPQIQADPAVISLKSIDFTADLEAISANYESAQRLITSLYRGN